MASSLSLPIKSVQSFVQSAALHLKHLPSILCIPLFLQLLMVPVCNVHLYNPKQYLTLA
ncbi:hypothetical protein T4E_7120 [Trichinella pseudospiralis]|uniref:Uncharacterized protein n=1 Tax=Trichinella pseudospiralis TaxID=6337 RepID=A0A0V0XCU6_TRIPS|nr:hypothetical protein T4E_7120 [Trichinella pseudospiralis]